MPPRRKFSILHEVGPFLHKKDEVVPETKQEIKRKEMRELTESLLEGVDDLFAGRVHKVLGTPEDEVDNGVDVIFDDDEEDEEDQEAQAQMRFSLKKTMQGLPDWLKKTPTIAEIQEEKQDKSCPTTVTFRSEQVDRRQSVVSSDEEPSDLDDAASEGSSDSVRSVDGFFRFDPFDIQDLVLEPDISKKRRMVIVGRNQTAKILGKMRDGERVQIMEELNDWFQRRHQRAKIEMDAYQQQEDTLKALLVEELDQLHEIHKSIESKELDLLMRMDGISRKIRNKGATEPRGKDEEDDAEKDKDALAKPFAETEKSKRKLDRLEVQLKLIKQELEFLKRAGAKGILEEEGKNGKSKAAEVLEVISKQQDEMNAIHAKMAIVTSRIEVAVEADELAHSEKLAFRNLSNGRLNTRTTAEPGSASFELLESVKLRVRQERLAHHMKKNPELSELVWLAIQLNPKSTKSRPERLGAQTRPQKIINLDKLFGESDDDDELLEEMIKATQATRSNSKPSKEKPRKSFAEMKAFVDEQCRELEKEIEELQEGRLPSREAAPAVVVAPQPAKDATIASENVTRSTDKVEEKTDEPLEHHSNSNHRESVSRLLLEAESAVEILQQNIDLAGGILPAVSLDHQTKSLDGDYARQGVIARFTLKDAGHFDWSQGGGIRFFEAGSEEEFKPKLTPQLTQQLEKQERANQSAQVEIDELKAECEELDEEADHIRNEIANLRNVKEVGMGSSPKAEASGGPASQTPKSGQTPRKQESPNVETGQKRRNSANGSEDGSDPEEPELSDRVRTLPVQVITTRTSKKDSLPPSASGKAKSPPPFVSEAITEEDMALSVTLSDDEKSEDFNFEDMLASVNVKANGHSSRKKHDEQASYMTSRLTQENAKLNHKIKVVKAQLSKLQSAAKANAEKFAQKGQSAAGGDGGAISTVPAQTTAVSEDMPEIPLEAEESEKSDESEDNENEFAEDIASSVSRRVSTVHTVLTGQGASLADAAAAAMAEASRLEKNTMSAAMKKILGRRPEQVNFAIRLPKKAQLQPVSSPSEQSSTGRAQYLQSIKAGFAALQDLGGEISTVDKEIDMLDGHIKAAKNLDPSRVIAVLKQRVKGTVEEPAIHTELKREIKKRQQIIKSFRNAWHNGGGAGGKLKMPPLAKINERHQSASIGVKSVFVNVLTSLQKSKSYLSEMPSSLDGGLFSARTRWFRAYFKVRDLIKNDGIKGTPLEPLPTTISAIESINILEEPPPVEIDLGQKKETVAKQKQRMEEMPKKKRPAQIASALLQRGAGTSLRNLVSKPSANSATKAQKTEVHSDSSHVLSQPATQPQLGKFNLLSDLVEEASSNDEALQSEVTSVQ